MSVRILTVDDSRMVRVVVAKAFAPYGCEVLEASSGTEALAVAVATAPDLIFLDVTMSDLNGLVVLEKLRARTGASAELTGRPDHVGVYR